MNEGITESLEIPAPAEAVWSVISDIPALPTVLSGMTAISVEGHDTSLRPGLAWTQTRVIRGHTGSERLEVTEVVPGSRYVTEGGSHGFAYVTVWTVEPLGPNSSRVTCTFRGEPRTWFARVMFRLFGGAGAAASREAMRTDLVDVAGAAERTS
jgi:carbon monoxide dehydrogenase subunit G